MSTNVEHLPPLPTDPKEIAKRKAEAEAKLELLQSQHELLLLERRINILQSRAAGTTAPVIAKMSEFMLQIQTDQDAVRMGDLTEQQARAVFNGHNHIIRAFEAQIKLHRMSKTRVRTADGKGLDDFNILPLSAEPKSLKE
jgi:hypothetical protein